MTRYCLCLLALLLGACASSPPAPPVSGGPAAEQPTPQAEPLSKAGNHSPYRVHGRTYRVLPSSSGYRERGVASWYGPNFQGRKTSNLEVFDMHKFTAAHRSLPLPSYARVTNLSNNRSVVVRINDRGPFKDNRLIDLSFAAARALDMIEAGTTRVEVEVLEPVDTPGERPLVRSAPGIYVQLGAFASRGNAIGLMTRLRDEGIEDAQLYSVTTPQTTIHRVRIGPLPSVLEADRMIAQLSLLGHELPRVVFE